MGNIGKFFDAALTMITLAELLSGLGLLFIGLRLLGQHLRQAAGMRMRRALRAATASRWSGLLAGAMAGALAQSSNAVTLITANLVQGRVMSLAQAAPVVAGANAGTAALVFLATLDLRLVVLYMVAAAGLSLHFKLDRHAARRDWIWAGLGLALLFMGLDLIKHAPAGLSADDWRALLGQGLSLPVAALLGAVMALVTQSASAASILAVAALHGGFIGFDAAFWIMTGANVGSGVAVLLSGSGLRGSGRRLCLIHVMVKLGGSAIVAPAWLLGARGIDAAAAGAPLLLALLFLAMQVAGALPLTLWRERAVALAGRFTPDDPVELASQPHYIYDRAVEDPVNALVLAALERDRLVRRLPALLPDLDSAPAPAPQRRAELEGARSIVLQTEAFLVSLMSRSPARAVLDQALHAQSQLENLRALLDTVEGFARIVDARGAHPTLLFNLSEALRTLAGLLADTAGEGGPDADDLDTLIRISGDRGELLERMRRQVAASDAHDEAAMRDLLAATRLFERAVWLIGRMAIARREREAPLQAV
ncbi:MAG: Na/Pi symporter [Bordetella sp.]|nr:Na/Pi symporter [Bordetella sp.]